MIEAMPALPIPEVAKPRTLDVAAIALQGIGAFEHAAIVMGRAEAMELPTPSIIPREPALTALRQRLEADRGAAEVNRLAAEGAVLDVDDCLNRAYGWLSKG